MLSYENCPNNLPCMPIWPTIDGRPLPGSAPVYTMDSDSKPVDYIPGITSFTIPVPEPVFGLDTWRFRDFPVKNFDFHDDPVEVEKACRQYLESKVSSAIPTLVSIGLLDALLEVEGVLAWNQTEKHPGAKWKSKSIDWHDSKAISHLSKAQNESLKDDETGRSHRAHACCRLLMSLAHEKQSE